MGPRRPLALILLALLAAAAVIGCTPKPLDLSSIALEPEPFPLSSVAIVVASRLPKQLYGYYGATLSSRSELLPPDTTTELCAYGGWYQGIDEVIGAGMVERVADFGYPSEVMRPPEGCETVGELLDDALAKGMDSVLVVTYVEIGRSYKGRYGVIHLPAASLLDATTGAVLWSRHLDVGTVKSHPIMEGIFTKTSYVFSKDKPEVADVDGTVVAKLLLDEGFPPAKPSKGTPWTPSKAVVEAAEAQQDTIVGWHLASELTFRIGPMAVVRQLPSTFEVYDDRDYGYDDWQLTLDKPLVGGGASFMLMDGHLLFTNQLAVVWGRIDEPLVDEEGVSHGEASDALGVQVEQIVGYLFFPSATTRILLGGSMNYLMGGVIGEGLADDKGEILGRLDGGLTAGFAWLGEAYFVSFHVSLLGGLAFSDEGWGFGGVLGSLAITPDW